MTLDDFREIFDGLPAELYEYAEGAEEVQDNEDVRKAGKAYLEARAYFFDILEAYGISVG